MKIRNLLSTAFMAMVASAANAPSMNASMRAPHIFSIDVLPAN